MSGATHLPTRRALPRLIHRRTPADRRSASDFKREQASRAAGTVSPRKSRPRGQKHATAQRVESKKKKKKKKTRNYFFLKYNYFKKNKINFFLKNKINFF